MKKQSMKDRKDESKGMKMMHKDEKQDKKMIKSMVKKDCMKKK